jgi:hypothetical protein
MVLMAKALLGLAASREPREQALALCSTAFTHNAWVALRRLHGVLRIRSHGADTFCGELRRHLPGKPPQPLFSTRCYAFVAREGESVAELLERLDAALGKAMPENIVIDEVQPEIKRLHPS